MHPAGPDPLIGRVLEGRYRIRARIAVGGMSTVYAALDERLDREVAVKVMAPSLSSDPVFLDRFAREARTAAKLSHVNAVSVYDQGRDDGNVFLVMELVRGRTLRDLIRERGALSPGEAVSLMEPVLAALSAAHRAGLVHRDVKPENILLSDDGVVKVADFGLARAVETNASSQTGLMMGTVAYSSPEQFRRGNADARSDVYSAGIVLFELLTGQQPHSGPDAMSVAYSHVHQDTAPPSSLHRGVPPALDRLVARVTARDPAQRPPDAAAFLAELHDVRRELRLPVMPVPRRLRPRPGQPGLGRPGPGATAQAPVAARLTPSDPRAAGRTAPDPHRATRAGVQHTMVASPIPTGIGAPPPPAASHTGAGSPKPPRRRRRWLRTLVGTLVLLLVAAAITVGTWWYVAGRWVSVPDVRLDPITTARTTLEAAGFHVTDAPSQASESVKRGTVISTQPPGGQRLIRGHTVHLIASTGPNLYGVPDITGHTEAQAVAALAPLKAKGIRLTYTRRADDHIASGHVISVSPMAGSELTRTGAVTVVVSTGLPFVVVPKVTDQTLAAATTALTAAKFKPDSSSQAFSDTVPTGAVISQDPAAASKVRKFSVVTLVISKGVDLVTVPPIDSLEPVAAAEAALTAAGLKWEIQRDFGGTNGLVVGIDPKPGARLKRGTTVTLYVV